MKLLILHASAGNGHRRAAEALAEASVTAGCTTTVRDILDFTAPLYRNTYAKGYLNLVRAAPELWGYLYAQSDRHAQRPLDRRIRTVFNRLNTLTFQRFLKREAPDAVLCTHFMPLELVAHLRTGLRHGVQLHGVVTDFAVHALWFTTGVDAYYVATEEARRQLVRMGQPAERIILSGIPIASRFGVVMPPAQARRQLGLQPDKPTVLLLSGGYGVGPTVAIIRAMAAESPACQLIVVAGKNPDLETAAREAAQGAALPVTVLGFVSNIHDYMDAADLIISKPGGLTSAEALAKGKPLMIVDPIPGQEQRNCEYLIEAGCAVRLFDAPDAPWKIQSVLSDPVRLAALGANARQHGRPTAAADIIAAVMRAAM